MNDVRAGGPICMPRISKPLVISLILARTTAVHVAMILVADHQVLVTCSDGTLL